jgi:hypothetical protein
MAEGKEAFFAEELDLVCPQEDGRNKILINEKRIIARYLSLKFMFIGF